MKTSLSVVMATYNRRPVLERTLDALAAQILADHQVVVVDDGSTDKTKDVVGSFGDIRIQYIYQENRGLPAARNSGILTSTSEYIACLDADDIWSAQKLEVQVKL